MKYAISAAALAVMGALAGALALPVPASAQIVNGHNDINNPLPEAPIGTKGGGSAASLQAPGEGPAVDGALRNNAEANSMGLVSDRVVTHRHRHPLVTPPDNN